MGFCTTDKPVPHLVVLRCLPRSVFVQLYCISKSLVGHLLCGQRRQGTHDCDVAPCGGISTSTVGIGLDVVHPTHHCLDCLSLQEHEDLSDTVQGWKAVWEQLFAERKTAQRAINSAGIVLKAAAKLAPRLLQQPAEWLEVRHCWNFSALLLLHISPCAQMHVLAKCSIGWVYL